MTNLYAFLRPRIKACLYAGAVFLTLSVNAQNYYPAGLGNGNLQLWLTATDPSTVLNPAGTLANNGDFIVTWKDKSGRGADASQSTGGIQPVYQTNMLNGSGAVIFQNNTQYMTGPIGAYQTIVATRTILGNSYQYLFSSPANTDFSVRTAAYATPSDIEYTQGPNYEDWDAYFWSYPYNMWLNGVAGTYTSSATHILVDEGASATNATYSISNTFSTRGLYDNDPVYELLAYNGTPNNTQRILLENYQASEWGLTGSDFLGSAGYAMAAHNAQSNTVNYNQTLNNVPANMYVWNRSWYVQLSGGNSAGNISLTFNFNDYNGTFPNPSDYFELLYNPSDGTFGSGTNTLVPIVSSNVSGNSVSFVVNASKMPNGYYTIIYDQNITLPITLDNFSVTKLSPGAALAKWAVGPESGEGYFVLQHSTDGLQFTSIDTVAATNNDAFAENYSYTDNSPSQGINYYRLAMVNAVGVTAYSQIGILTFGAHSCPVTLYPIPTGDILHLSAPCISEARNIDLVSVTGQVLKSFSVSTLDGSDLSVSWLPAGPYFVHIRGGGQSFVLPFLKQ